VEKAEIHVHTTASDGAMPPEALVRKARAMGLAALAVTDHNTFRGSSLAARIARLLGAPIIVPGNEVRTEHGDVLVLCPDHHPRAPRGLEELRDWADENNCILVAAHPYRPSKSSIGRALPRIIHLFDAVEAWNTRNLPPCNALALRAARRAGKPVTSGSDAHVPSEVASSPVILPGRPGSPEDLIEWVRRGAVRPVYGLPRLRSIPEALAWAVERRLRR